MLDRQDIDALFMGALYGELSPAESTRLEEHLSAHPADRMVLDGLGRARQALRDSHVLALQAEPPAAVSALLLQEAARRAPEPRVHRVGFFAKLTALLRHPATAAAAVVVLVAGVASTIYLRDGDRAMVEQEISTSQPAAPTLTPEPAATGPAAPERQAGEAPAIVAGQHQFEFEGVAPEDGFKADLDTDTRNTTDGKREPARDKLKKTQSAAGDELDRQRGAKGAGGGAAETEKTEKTADKADNAKGSSKDANAGRRYIEVTTPDPKPKTLADSRPNVTSGAGATTSTDRTKTGSVIVPADPGTGTTGLAMGGDALTAPGSTQQKSSAPQPNKRSATDDASVQADTAAREKAKYSAALAQHNKVVELVKANKCRDAARAAGALYESNSDYYGEFVANDRRVKACRSYIDVERKKRNEAMKSKSRAYQDSPAEASPSPNTSNK